MLNWHRNTYYCFLCFVRNNVLVLAKCIIAFCFSAVALRADSLFCPRWIALVGNVEAVRCGKKERQLSELKDLYCKRVDSFITFPIPNHQLYCRLLSLFIILSFQRYTQQLSLRVSQHRLRSTNYNLFHCPIKQLIIVIVTIE